MTLNLIGRDEQGSTELRGRVNDLHQAWLRPEVCSSHVSHAQGGAQSILGTRDRGEAVKWMVLI